MSTLLRTITAVSTIVATESLSVPITENSRFNEDLNCDSLDMLEIVMTVEDEFQIEIYDEKIEGLVTVGDLVRLIETSPPNEPYMFDGPAENDL